VGNLALTQLNGTVQDGCTNTPPMRIIPPVTVSMAPEVRALKYDIVFDYDQDGYYDIGRDLLDVVAHHATGELGSVLDLDKLDDESIYGFQIVKE
jgi:hypothetical protein